MWWLKVQTWTAANCFLKVLSPLFTGAISYFSRGLLETGTLSLFAFEKLKWLLKLLLEYWLLPKLGHRTHLRPQQYEAGHSHPVYVIRYVYTEQINMAPSGVEWTSLVGVHNSLIVEECVWSVPSNTLIGFSVRFWTNYFIWWPWAVTSCTFEENWVIYLHLLMYCDFFFKFKWSNTHAQFNLFI